MECWHCGRPAQATCKFCGRAVCKEHAQRLPSIVSVFTAREKHKAIVVADAIYCGLCKPQDDPVELSDV